MNEDPAGKKRPECERPSTLEEGRVVFFREPMRCSQSDDVVFPDREAAKTLESRPSLGEWMEPTRSRDILGQDSAHVTIGVLGSSRGTKGAGEKSPSRSECGSCHGALRGESTGPNWCAPQDRRLSRPSSEVGHRRNSRLRWSVDEDAGLFSGTGKSGLEDGCPLGSFFVTRGGEARR